MSQAALSDFEDAPDDEPHPDAVRCECIDSETGERCGSTDVIPHTPTRVDSDAGSLELSDEPRVCYECSGSSEHWDAKYEANTSDIELEEIWATDRDAMQTPDLSPAAKPSESYMGGDD